MTFLTAAIALLSLVVSSVAQANDIRAAAPALETYARPPLRRGREAARPVAARPLTLAVLIASRQTVEMPYYVNLASTTASRRRKSLRSSRISRSTRGWANAMSAVAATKEVFAQRRIGSDQLSPVSPTLLPLNEAAEHERATRVGQQFGAVSPESCSTPPTSCSAISGCARTSRPGIGVLVTISALIASGQVAQLGSHLHRAMDNSLTQPQVSEVLTHLAFYAGWPNVFSALPVAKDVFEKRPQ